MDSHDSLKSMYEKLVESLTCGICHNVLKEARDLACGHTYCLACIKEYAAIKGWTKIIMCCQCRKQTAVPAQGLTGLKQNYKLNCIIEEQGNILKRMNMPEKAATAREPEIQVFVRDLDGKIQTINIRLSDGVGVLKRAVEKKTGIPVNTQSLIFRSKQLVGGQQTLGELRIQLHCIIELVLTQKGGISF